MKVGISTLVIACQICVESQCVTIRLLCEIITKSKCNDNSKQVQKNISCCLQIIVDFVELNEKTHSGFHTVIHVR